jgi:hypothetical protein
VPIASVHAGMKNWTPSGLTRGQAVGRLRLCLRLAVAASTHSSAARARSNGGGAVRIAIKHGGTGTLGYKVAEVGSAEIILDAGVVDVIRHVGPASSVDAVVVGWCGYREEVCPLYVEVVSCVPDCFSL